MKLTSWLKRATDESMSLAVIAGSASMARKQNRETSIVTSERNCKQSNKCGQIAAKKVKSVKSNHVASVFFVNSIRLRNVKEQRGNDPKLNSKIYQLSYGFSWEIQIQSVG